MSDGLVGLFRATDDTKLLPYITLLRASIYEYLSVELFENAGQAQIGSGYIDPIAQKLKFTGVGQVYTSTDLIDVPNNPSISTAYNNDCVFYATVESGAPTFEISHNNVNWFSIASGSQYLYSSLSSVSKWYIRVTSTTANDVVGSFGVVYIRKPKFRTIINSDI